MSPARLVATWFGCGASPIAPGTVGTAGALPLYFALRELGTLGYFAGVAVVCLAGVWASELTSRELGVEDPQSVVIDEVAGALIALGLAGGAFWPSCFALVLFRALDIKKPGPIDSVQRLRPPGVGIMADDVLAGLAAGLIARAVALI